MLKKDLCFASLSGEELVEFKWYMDNKPFFTSNQYIPIDRGNINPARVKEYGITPSNVHSGEEMEHVLRSVRTEKKLAIINADYLCTVKTCMNTISPMIRMLEICTEKIGECFLFINAVTEFINSKEIAEANKLITNYICTKFIYDYFPETDYVPVTPELLKYNGNKTSTKMFSFCLHLLK